MIGVGLCDVAKAGWRVWRRWSGRMLIKLSTKSRKLLRFSPKRKRKSEKNCVTSPHVADMAARGNGVSDGQRAEMKQAFDMFDKNNDGKISSDELGGVLRTLGHEYNQGDIEDMIKHADINENGYVEYDEFLLLMKRWSTENSAEENRQNMSEEEQTKETFKVFDMDGNGYIDRHELRYIMKRLGENLGEDDVKDMFKLADLNGDGLIDYEEFSKLLGGLGGGMGGLAAALAGGDQCGAVGSGGDTPSSSSSSGKHSSKSSKSSGKKK